VLPTGLGKTNIAVLLAAHRLERFRKSKALVLAPTRPLVSQHYRSFMRFLSLEDVELTTVTGTTKPADRRKVYDDSIVRVIFATPQTIRNDLGSGLLNLRDFSLLVIDETHHSVGMYAYPFVVSIYREQARNKRILGLTASPGSDLSKIKDVMKNTGLEAVEIRAEEEGDVSPYVMEKHMKWVNVSLPERFVTIASLIQGVCNEKVSTLRRMGYVRGSFVSKKQLLELQRRFAAGIRQNSGKRAFIGMFLVNQAIKLEHAHMLLETQGISVLENYWRKIRTGRTKADKTLSGNSDVSNAMHLTHSLYEEGASHPKVGRLLGIVSQQLSKKSDSRIIVFANYRDSVKEIVESLGQVDRAMPVEFVGQREGMTQKEQAQRLRDFSEGKHNILVCTSIGEEGLDIPSMDIAIFYEPVPSGIRSIQRRGRVGRQVRGEVILLITKGTRDEAYYWSSLSKEKSMKKALYGMRNSL
ncbi:MAG: DEAD/DEAH box helicase, partial [Candidatus Aenigmarchaeota archaeon]|nr:DEAD/DEAH box helicase [Candidatus Aenigmarchaeota archaeon]